MLLAKNVNYIIIKVFLLRQLKQNYVNKQTHMCKKEAGLNLIFFMGEGGDSFRRRHAFAQPPV